MANFSAFGPQPLEAYASTTSVEAGQAIGFSVAVQALPSSGLDLSIYRTGQLSFQASQFNLEADTNYLNDYRPLMSVNAGQTPVFETGFNASVQTVPSNASVNGCGWPVAVSWNVPANAPSDVYIARITRGTDITYVLFVVKPARAARGIFSTILCQLSFNSYQAYNNWGGNCFYAPPVSLGLVDQVAFDRPCQLWDYMLYDQPIIAWLAQSFPLEFCTNVDLALDDRLLDRYQLFISCGHDEYWSDRMRDRVEAFGLDSGNVLFLTGNTMYRRVEFTAAGRLMRRVKIPNDPRVPPEPNPLQPGWRDFGRPEALTTGLMWSGGHWTSALPSRGYTVADATSWVFAGTGLNNGGIFGQTATGGIIGYETDMAVYDGSGNPIAPTPANFQTIASAALPDWLDNPPTPEGATMGAFARSSRGIIVATGTTGWGQALSSADASTQRITLNMVSVLRYPLDSLVWFKDQTLNGTGIVRNGVVAGRYDWFSAYDTVFASPDGIVYAIGGYGLLQRFPSQTAQGMMDIDDCQTIGLGAWDTDFVTVFSGGAGIVYGIDSAGALHRYVDPGTGDNIGAGQVVNSSGWSGFLFVFSGGSGIIYAIDTSGTLNVYTDPGGGSPVTLKNAGGTGWGNFKFVFSGGKSIVYAVDPGGKLYWFFDQNNNGQINGNAGAAIGQGGWSTFARVFSSGNGNIYAILPANLAGGGQRLTA